LDTVLSHDAFATLAWIDRHCHPAHFDDGLGLKSGLILGGLIIFPFE